jgi:hypothetical protein
MTEGFSAEVKENIGEAQNWYCKNCLNKIDSFHHMLSNSNVNGKKFPLFLNSPFNCVGLCQQCHDSFPHLYKVTEKEAEVYENYLKGLK